MAGMNFNALIAAGLAAGLLSGCEPGTGGGGATTADAPLADTGADAAVASVPSATSVKLIDHDIEAPQVFQTTDKGLWDGRPSLGGVWVATPDAKDPERVIIRNPTNGKFVIGALFRREADNPGPKLQISSDAADALGMLAGEPATLNVTALRREEAAAPVPDANKPLLDAAETVLSTPINDVAATASAAIDKASAAPAATATTPASPDAASDTSMADAVAPAAAAPVRTGPSPAPGPKIISHGTSHPSEPAATALTEPSTLPATDAVTTAPLAAAKPTAAVAAPAAPAASSASSGSSGSGTAIQIGIFSVESNANRAVATLAKAGITASVRQEVSHGKPLWSVVATGSAATLAKIKSAGFADAYILKQ